MKLTKKDGYYHKREFNDIKKDSRGILNSLQNDSETNKEELKKLYEYVNTRFNDCIESSIYNEFIRIDGTERLSVEEGDSNLQVYKEFYRFIKHLYTKSSEKPEFCIKNLLKVALKENKIQVGIKKKDNKFIKRYIKLQYKINKHEYFIKENSQEKKPYHNISFIDLFSRFQEDIECFPNEDYLGLESYTLLKEAFQEYRERKIKKTVKSITENKVVTEKKDNNNIEYTTTSLKYFHQLFSNLVESAEKNNEDSYLEAILSAYENVIELKSAYEILVGEFNDFDAKRVRGKRYKDIIRKILTLLQDKIKVTKELSQKDIDGLSIYFEEVKKYLLLTDSKKKRDKKERKGRKSNNENKTYNHYIAKALCIKNGHGNYDSFQRIIRSGFQNRFTNFIIDYGKRLYYSFYDAKLVQNNIIFDTGSLEFIKARESLTRKLAGIISFASHSFYQLFNFDSEQEDILGGHYTIPHINNLNRKRVNYFFNIDSDSDIADFIYVLSEAIYAFRNGVVHFKDVEDEFKNIFSQDIKNCELDELEGRKVIDKDIKKKFNPDIDLIQNVYKIYDKQAKKIPQYIYEKFRSNSLENYFSIEELQIYFNLYRCNLDKNSISYTPSFQRISKAAKKYAESDDKQYSYWNIDNIEEKEHSYKVDKEQPYSVVKNFLLKELYYNVFLTKFLDGQYSSLFFDAVERAIDAKKDRRNNDEESHSYAVFKKYQHESVAIYISNLHKELLNREVMQGDREEQDKTVKHVVSFINEIFLQGFIAWLDENKMGFLKNKTKLKKECTNYELTKRREYIEKVLLKEKQYADFSLSPDKQERVLSLYLLLSMVDSVRVVQFKNEIVRYEQIGKNLKGKSSNLPSVDHFLGINLSDYKAVCDFILLTTPRLSTDDKEDEQVSRDLFYRYYDSNDEYRELLTCFVDRELLENLKEKDQLYFANEMPILYSNIENMNKFSTRRFLQNIISHCDIQYTEKEREDKVNIDIEGLHKTREALHKKWIDSKSNKVTFTEENINKYKEIVRKINSYDYLYHKETLRHVYILHEITSELMGRFVAFIHKWERDVKFFMVAIKRHLNNTACKKDIEDFLEPKAKDKKVYFNINRYFKKYTMHNLKCNSKVHKDVINPLLFKLTDDCFIKKWFNIRNYIAHFTHMNSKKGEYIVKSCTHSFIDQMNTLIRLFSYDKKTQNHINKAIKTILEKYNIEVTFVIDEENSEPDKGYYTYKIATVKSKTIKHLGGEVETPYREDEFLKLVKCLLEYNNSYKGDDTAVVSFEEAQIDKGKNKHINRQKKGKKKDTFHSTSQEQNRSKSGFSNNILGEKLKGFGR